MAVLGERVSSPSVEFDEPTCGDLPGDTATAGRLVVAGAGVEGQHHTSTDVDWYAVSLDAGVDYQFDADPTDPQPRLYLLKIHDDQGTELRTSAIAPVEGPQNYYQLPNRVNSLPFRTDQAGAYYVSIASPKGGEAPDRVYTLTARSDDHPADTSTTAVAELGEPTRVYLMRTSSDPDDTATDDVDWVRASLLANVRYHISFDVGKCGQTAVIEGIHDADGTAIPMTSSSGACSASMYFTPPTKGDYYIAVTGKGSQFVDKDDVDDDDGRLKGTYHDRYPFTGADADLRVSVAPNYCAGESFDTLRDALTPLSEPSGGDLPAGTSTAGRSPIGSSVTGNIESATDRDWFRVRFDGRVGERVYWLELKGADTGDGTLRDPLIVGIYDRQGNYIPYSHVLGQSLTWNNDSGHGRNAITDFTEPCAGDYFVAVAGFEGSTGSYTLSVTDITDTSTSIPGQSRTGQDFAQWVDDSVAYRGYVPYFDLGDKDEAPGAMLYNFWLVDDKKNGDLSIEFKAPRFYEVEGRNIPSRLLVAFELGEYHFEPGDVYTVVLTDITDAEDDYLGAEETTGTVAVGGSVTGNLEVDNDVDWFKVRLEEGKSYRIRMRGSESGGGTLADLTVVVGTITSVSAGYYGFGAPPPFNDDKSTTEKDSELVVPVFTTHDAYIHAATSGTGTGTYTIEVEEVPSMQNQRANSPATGGPGIIGSLLAGETLTATTENIEDEDGLTGAVFAYQWFRSDTDIEGAISSTYTMTGDDEGKAIQVRVTFSDDAGNEESLTSYARLSAPPLTIRDAGVIASNTPATGEPTITGTAQVGETLTADTTDISDSDGLINASFTYRWLASDGTSDSDISGASSSTYTPVASDEGKTITVRVSFTDDRGHQETLTSTATAAVAASPPNSVATGAPAISGTVQVAQTLTASTSDISDSDGLTNPTFTYQWLADDADITDATGSTYTPAAADEGKTIKVRVSFTDDRGQQETLTSTATATVASAPSPLTAAIHDAPGSHDGTTDFTFELRFSEDLKEDFSYQTLRDHAFTVKGGTMAGARQMDGDSDTPNIRWEVTVEPDSNADVTVELSATEDCDAQGAICTADGTMLSIPLKFTVEGPPLTASFESVPTSHNGSDNFKFRIAFSEELETNCSYKTLRDHVVTVEGGTVVGARRLVSGSNIRWEISVEPDSNADVTVELPVTEDCDAQGAICADGDKKLSNRLELTVSRPGS